MQKTYLAGFGRSDITPKEPVPLGGYGNTDFRMSENFLDFLYGTCIAATEGDTTVMFYTVDLLLPPDAWVKELRDRLSVQYDVPKENITVSFTHTHSGPDIYSSQESIKAYRVKWVEAMVKAGVWRLSGPKTRFTYAP